MSAYLTLEVYAPRRDEHDSDRDGGSLFPREKGARERALPASWGNVTGQSNINSRWCTAGNLVLACQIALDHQPSDRMPSFRAAQKRACLSQFPG